MVDDHINVRKSKQTKREEIKQVCSVVIQRKIYQRKSKRKIIEK
jgi:hypothetical protein